MLKVIAPLLALSSIELLVCGFQALPKTLPTNQVSRSSLLMSTSSFGAFPEEFNSNYNQDSDSESRAEFASGHSTDQYDSNDGAFPLIDGTDATEARQLRWEREAMVQSKFVSDDDVFELRQKISDLRLRLMEARENLAEEGQQRRIRELEEQLFSLNTKDAEFMYAMSLELMENAQQEGDLQTAEKYRLQAAEARLGIPQLNMHGLWCGKYGDHGFEMINITYAGETLIATKVTGDQNVPKGEVSFTVDLSPHIHSERGMLSLEPIELNDKAARQWGKKFLPRFQGQGQVAAEGFTNSKWLEGQLILVGRFFSFAWVPIGHQVFFGRPSSELTLKMLREQQEDELKRDQVSVMREAANNMMEETYWIEKEDSFEDGWE
mmetsp:Transcript_3203/g.4604  ORF Transcript_3203/g.4604 Transcript_3203/m.4604 type:complete len:379 (+) Transcript_3203:133-1269(+)